jgi:hypothetical protein
MEGRRRGPCDRKNRKPAGADVFRHTTDGRRSCKPPLPRALPLPLADWKTDPHGVIAAFAGWPEAQHAPVVLVVPAALHGVDWVGDPYANVPCARRFLDELTDLLHAAGIDVLSAAVGDHDPVAAAIDATLLEPIEQIVVCGLKRRIKLFDLGHRVRRATGLPVLSVPVPPTDRRGRGWLRLQRGECGMTERVGPGSQPATV